MHHSKSLIIMRQQFLEVKAACPILNLENGIKNSFPVRNPPLFLHLFAVKQVPYTKCISKIKRRGERKKKKTRLRILLLKLEIKFFFFFNPNKIFIQFFMVLITNTQWLQRDIESYLTVSYSIDSFMDVLYFI